MQTYANVVSLAIPLFLVLIVIEYLISRYQGKNVLDSFDTISSLSSGITNVIKDVLGLAVVIISYTWMVDHLALFSIENSILIHVLAFIGLDFAGYWSHRFEHEINLLWNRHIIHHSSEEFNLACALRQSISSVLSIFFFLYIPMAIIGIPSEVIAIVAPIHLFAQFWYHTRLIDKMGFLEYIIVTPSHHRVHHAINDKYLDKNFSQIFIVWDNLFGTFQEEIKSEPPVYGVKKQVNTWNPILINFQHLTLMIKDFIHEASFVERLKILFGPTGYRSQKNIKERPIEYTEDAQSQIKYATTAPAMIKVWCWVQLFIHLFFMIMMFQSLSDYGFMYILFYGAFIYLGVFSYTSFMDGSKMAIYSEILRHILSITIVYLLESWFGSSIYLTSIVFVYLVFSTCITIFFINKITFPNERKFSTP